MGHSTFTSSHTLWSTVNTFMLTAKSATCWTTQEKARFEAIQHGIKTGHGLSGGSYITTEDRNILIKMWTKMLNSKNYLGN
jgi:hypothetical protein